MIIFNAASDNTITDKSTVLNENIQANNTYELNKNLVQESEPNEGSLMKKLCEIDEQFAFPGKLLFQILMFQIFEVSNVTSFK